MAEEENLSKSRPQRHNAGNRMSKLIDDEQEVDDFYKTAFGGFEEVSGDEEFDENDEEDVDVVDSDFSNSETDEVIDQDDDEPKRKKKKVFIKPYRQPNPEDSIPKEKATPKPKEKTPREGLRKSTRTLTVSKAEELKQRQYEEKEKRSKQKQPIKPKAPPGMRRLTQEELLAEAKITEEHNSASLAAYQRLEADRKKTKIQKVTFKGPIIRYCSLSMPVLEIHEPIVRVDENDKDEEDTKPNYDPAKRCSRNFLIFTEPKNFPEEYFPVKKVKAPQRKYCPVTGLPARYRDPLTGLPFSNVQAFRYIRERYVMQKEEMKEKGGVENETRKRK